MRMLGLFMLIPVFELEAHNYQHFTPLLMGLALGIYGLSQALLQIPLGLLSDRLGRHRVIIFGLLLFLGGSVLAALSDSLYGIIVGRALQGAGAIASTLMALVADLTQEQNRSKAMAMIGGSIGLSFMLAMVIGPLVAAAFGLPGIFWLTALLAVIGLGMVQFRIPRPVKMVHNRETRTDFSLIGELVSNGQLRRLNISVFCLHMLLMAAFTAVPSALKAGLQLPESSMWWLYLLLMGGGFVLMLPFMIRAEKQQRHRATLLGAVALVAVTMAAAALSLHTGLALAAALFGFFAAFNYLEASLPSWLSKIAPAGYRGTAMGIYSTAQFFGAFVGGLLGGLCLQYGSAQLLFWLLAAIALLWLVAGQGLVQPLAAQTITLRVGTEAPDLFAQRITAIEGIMDLMLIPGEELAYAKVDKNRVDWQSLQPFM